MQTLIFLGYGHNILSPPRRVGDLQSKAEHTALVRLQRPHYRFEGPLAIQ
jgi:hypothetical protein